MLQKTPEESLKEKKICRPLRVIMDCLTISSEKTSLKNETCMPVYEMRTCFNEANYNEVKSEICPFEADVYSSGARVKNQNLTRNITALCSPMNSSFIIETHCVKNYVNTSFDIVNLNSSTSQVYSGSHGSPKNDDGDYLLRIYGALRILTSAGHAISFAFLLIAIILFTSLKRLHCMRVTIHINLMASFLVRAILWYLHIPMKNADDLNTSDLKDILSKRQSVEDLMHIKSTYDYHCAPPGITWCEVYSILHEYVIIANYFWILIEGVYLWILLQAFSVPTKKTLICFLFFGWGCPWIPVVVYGLNAGRSQKCWNAKDCTSILWWIIKTPILLSLCINLVFFVMIMKIVASKLRFSIRSNRRNNENNNSYKWRLAKATLSLIPLFGISYLLTIFCECNNYGNIGFIIIKYFELFVVSIEGSLVAVIYCFLNSEIQEEFGKLRRSWKLKKELNRGWGRPTTSGAVEHSRIATMTTSFGGGLSSINEGGSPNFHGSRDLDGCQMKLLGPISDRNSLKVPESPNTQRVNRISTDEVLENKKLEESNL